MTDGSNSKDNAAWVMGKLLTGEAKEGASIALGDRGVLFGDGLFETLPILKGQPIWWPEHRQRLLDSAKLIDLTIEDDELDACILDLSQLSKVSNVILRITVTRGVGGRGLVPAENHKSTLFATITPLPKSMICDTLGTIISSIRRNDMSPTSRIKSLTYLDAILAAKEAAVAGAADALMLNSKGRVCCSTIGNVFSVFGSHLITPPLTDGVLPGIMRSKIMSHASDLGLVAKEESLTAEDLMRADGLFLTNSLRLVRRVTQLDDHRFSQANASDPISQLQDHFESLLFGPQPH